MSGLDLTSEERALILSALERQTAIENKWQEFVELMCKALGCDDEADVEAGQPFERTVKVRFNKGGLCDNAVLGDAVRCAVGRGRKDKESVANRAFEVTIKEEA